MSIVSRFDSIELSKQKYDNSILLKNFRKIVIIFIRLPIWIGLIYILINTQKEHTDRQISRNIAILISYVIIRLLLV